MAHDKGSITQQCSGSSKRAHNPAAANSLQQRHWGHVSMKGQYCALSQQLGQYNHPQSVVLKHDAPMAPALLLNTYTDAHKWPAYVRIGIPVQTATSCRCTPPPDKQRGSPPALLHQAYSWPTQPRGEEAPQRFCKNPVLQLSARVHVLLCTCGMATGRHCRCDSNPHHKTGMRCTAHPAHA